MKERNRKLIVLLGVLGTSFSAILVRFSTAPSMVLVFYRMLFAALMMAVPGIRAFGKERENLTKKELLCCLVSGFFLALHFTAYFESVKQTSITCSVVLVNTEVFFVSFILLFFFHEKISAKRWAGILIAFAGSLIIAIGDSADLSGSLRGDLYALSGAAFVSVYTTMGRICRKNMSTASYTAAVYGIAALVTFLLLLVTGTPVSGYGPVNLLTAFGMTVLCTLLGHSVINWGLKYISPAFISAARLLEPVFSALLGILFFREIPSGTAVLGAVVIITGLFLAGDDK